MYEDLIAAINEKSGAKSTAKSDAKSGASAKAQASAESLAKPSASSNISAIPATTGGLIKTVSQKPSSPINLSAINPSINSAVSPAINPAMQTVRAVPKSAESALFAIQKKQNPLNPDGFIKVAEKPLSQFNANQKVVLNRKGNEFFNAGNIENAARIFMSTGYSDGLTRIGDYYLRNKEELTALKFYTLAHNQTKIDFLSEKIAKIISQLLGSVPEAG
ncbi:MAG: hypothetical protein Ta2A_05300 [Treponemataceae bacterium]|nr:MAG: hypothetical protein Ta2A_05300 [Treponemataceae bacterium]